MILLSRLEGSDQGNIRLVARVNVLRRIAGDGLIGFSLSFRSELLYSRYILRQNSCKWLEEPDSRQGRVGDVKAKNYDLRLTLIVDLDRVQPELQH